MNYTHDKKLCIKVFNNYAKQFDLKNSHIKRKFIHSYNVAKYAETIGKNIFGN